MEEKIAQARALAKEMEAIPGVARAAVDDWNRFGEFSVIVTITKGPVSQQREFPMRTVTNAIRRLAAAAKAHGVIVAPPQREYVTRFGRKYFEGYESAHIHVDLAF